MNSFNDDTSSQNHNSPLMWAVVQNDAKQVLQLLSLAPPFDRVGVLSHANRAGETALHVAAREGSEKICALLLRFGANPNMATVEGLSPLHLAAFNGHRMCAKVLVAFGGQINMADLEGDRPLHWAVRGSQSALFSTLLGLGCDLAATNCDGETALDLAIQVKDRECVQTLLALGASASASVAKEDTWFILQEKPSPSSSSSSSSSSFPLLSQRTVDHQFPKAFSTVESHLNNPLSANQPQHLGMNPFVGYSKFFERLQFPAAASSSFF